ncbi:MAG: hypothetical protein IT226_02210 [Flavobacteriales bacterium]|nr:hypothetical protein [Flavobacteriales bacterium]
MKPGPGFILFGGTNDRALLALCRGFEEQKIPFGLIGRNERDLLKRSRYSSNYLLDRNSERLELDQILQAVHIGNARFGPRKWVICPTSEYLNIVLFGMKEELARAGVEVATCERALYEQLSNKASFRDYCESLGVPPPRIMDGRDGATSELPFVAKPKSNISKEGKVLYPYLVREEWDRARFLDEADPEEFYLEEFVLGENWYLLYYFSADGTYVKGAQRNFLQQGMGKSVVLARAMDYPEPEVEQAFAKRLSADGYRGFIMVELRRTSSGKAVTIEANPRCWGPFQLTRDADMGLFESFITDHGGALENEKRSGRTASYLWLGGCIQALRSGKGLDRHAERTQVIALLGRSLGNDIYARKGSWSCFMSDLCKR